MQRIIGHVRPVVKQGALFTSESERLFDELITVNNPIDRYQLQGLSRWRFPDHMRVNHLLSVACAASRCDQTHCLSVYPSLYCTRFANRNVNARYDVALRLLTSVALSTWFLVGSVVAQPDLAIVGRFVFQTTREGNDEIYVADADGSNPTILSNNAAEEQNPSWSPRGDLVLFMADQDGNFEIYVMDADGSRRA